MITRSNRLSSLLAKISLLWQSLPRKTAILILDWLIIFAVVFLMIVIYVPKSIWAEEESYRTESRRRLMILQNTEDIFHTVRGRYTTDGAFLIKLVSQLHDSLIADSTFIDEQTIHVNGTSYRVLIPEQLGYQMDTTFSVGRQLRREVLDTTYTVTLWNDDPAVNNYDTLYINGARGLAQIRRDSLFGEVLNTGYGSHSEVYTDYKWNRYRLEPELLMCPVTREQYVIKLDSTERELTIASPIEGAFVESRYLIFTFEANDHGEIVGGEPSWRVQ